VKTTFWRRRGPEQVISSEAARLDTQTINRRNSGNAGLLICKLDPNILDR
jgi:hypothetical protein